MQHSKMTHTLSVIIPAVSLFLLMFLFLLSGLISLGQQITLVSPILAWLYGLIVLACLGAGIIWPILSVWRRPIFSMYMLRYRDGRARFYWCRKLTDNLKKNTELTNEETAQLEDFLKQGNQADDLLIDFFTEKFSPVIDSEIKSAAKTAFVTTAISQTAFYDMFSMLSVNLHLIRTIVESCGYRPSGAALLGLYVRILKATFLAGGLEEMDLEELLPLALDFKTVTVESERALAAKELSEKIRKKGICEAGLLRSFDELMPDRLDAAHKTIAFGSLYFVGEIKKYFRDVTKITKNLQIY